MTKHRLTPEWTCPLCGHECSTPDAMREHQQQRCTAESQDRWHIGEAHSGNRVTIKDENGLFVAEAIREDGPLIAAAPEMQALLASVPVVALSGTQYNQFSDWRDKVEALLARLKEQS